jgi:hypothetical protein
MRRSSLLAVLACGLLVAFAVSSSLGGSTTAHAAGGPVFDANGPVTFDFVPVGASSAAKPATITNDGDAPLTITTVTLGGRDVHDFRVISDACSNATIAPGASCTTSVAFTPTLAGTRVAYLRILDNSSCPEYINLAGSGTGVAAVAAVAHAAACESATTTNTVTTPGRTNTVTTTTPSVGAASVVKLPSACSSRRTIVVRLAAPRGKSFARVNILLRGKVVKHLAGRSIHATVSLKGLPRGRFTVEVRATTTDGAHYVRDRYYVTCVATKS